MNVSCSSEELSSLIATLTAHQKSVSLTARGESMHPALCDGDLVRIDPVRQRLAVGDIVAYKDDADRLVLHRIIKIEKPAGQGKQYHIRGDNNRLAADRMPLSAIVGRVAAVERAGRSIPVEQCRASRLDRTARYLCGLLRALGKWSGITGV